MDEDSYAKLIANEESREYLEDIGVHTRDRYPKPISIERKYAYLAELQTDYIPFRDR